MIIISYIEKTTQVSILLIILIEYLPDWLFIWTKNLVISTDDFHFVFTNILRVLI